MLKVVSLISGRGSNLKSLITQAKAYSIIGIVSDKPDAPGLQFGKEFGIPTFAKGRSEFSSLQDHKEAIYNIVRSLKPDLICLAGFMQIVAPSLINDFPSRIINIHPALLPSFPGLHTHERAIEAKVSEHGCTVHVVDAGVDTGAIIAQAKVPVLPDDTAEILAARVLEREHKLYPWVVNKIAEREIKIEGSKVTFSDLAVKESNSHNFHR